ncbi:hypothetical protein NDU88_002293 [Pleurodeles waltl]|uniref:Uncharacterized protein n=1 Tax=Pleurodeles waltl TaxID=8319 RepID=A0AAV7RDJ9_PLEWA|nr:hypothetical protein NDU88_002293 [Pleurodeles waltl]
MYVAARVFRFSQECDPAAQTMSSGGTVLITSAEEESPVNLVVPSCPLGDTQHEVLQELCPKSVIMQGDAKIMLNLILEEIRELKATQVSEIAALHVRLSKIEGMIAQLSVGLKEVDPEYQI